MIKFNLKLDKDVNFLMILYQIIKGQNSFENLSFKEINKLEKRDKDLIKNILRNKSNFSEKIKQYEKLNKIYLENKEKFENYWNENKNLLIKIKNKLEEKCNVYNFSIFEKVGNFFDYQGPEEINFYVCLGNETDVGTGNAFSPNLAFIFPRNFNNYSKETIDADFAVLIHEIMHLFQNMCNEKDKNLREKVAQCFAPRGLLINENKFNGDMIIFNKIKLAFQDGKKYFEIRENLLRDNALLEENEFKFQGGKNEKI